MGSGLGFGIGLGLGLGLGLGSGLGLGLGLGLGSNPNPNPITLNPNQVGETLLSRHRKHQPQLAVVIGMEHMRGGPGGGHPLILTASLDPHALKQGVRRLALRSLLGAGR